MARTLGTGAGLAGAALLSTDPVYVLYSRWDHGPVVIQHLCLTGAMLALIRFDRERRVGWLAAGFFAVGVGVLGEAIFGWLVSGVGISGVVLFLRGDPGGASFPKLCVALGAFALWGGPPGLFQVYQRD